MKSALHRKVNCLQAAKAGRLSADCVAIYRPVVLEVPTGKRLSTQRALCLAPTSTPTKYPAHVVGGEALILGLA